MHLHVYILYIWAYSDWNPAHSALGRSACRHSIVENFSFAHDFDRFQFSVGFLKCKKYDWYPIRNTLADASRRAGPVLTRGYTSDFCGSIRNKIPRLIWWRIFFLTNLKTNFPKSITKFSFHFQSEEFSARNIWLNFEAQHKRTLTGPRS